MEKSMAYTVKRAAALAGVTVRTLHHYDHLGLLVPAGVSAAGYRLYSDDDMARLQQILFYRELDFDLEAIREILDRPEFDRLQALIGHRTLLAQKRERLGRLLATVESTIATLQGGTDMDTKDLFDGFDPAEYEEETRERWGHTDAYAQSKARTRAYTKADWTEVKDEMAAIYTDLAALMDREPADPAVQAVIQRWFDMINRRFYDCPLPMFRGLGDMGVDDPRFTKNIDKTKPGLAAFKRLAMHAFCDAREA